MEKGVSESRAPGNSFSYLQNRQGQLMNEDTIFAKSCLILSGIVEAGNEAQEENTHEKRASR